MATVSVVLDAATTRKGRYSCSTLCGMDRSPPPDCPPTNHIETVEQLFRLDVMMMCISATTNQNYFFKVFFTTVGTHTQYHNPG